MRELWVGPVLTVNFGFHRTRLVQVDGETVGVLVRRAEEPSWRWRFVPRGRSAF